MNNHQEPLWVPGIQLPRIQLWEYTEKGNLERYEDPDFTSKRSLLASISTANCSSPNVLMQAVAPHEAVRTLKAIVRMASPMHTSSLARLLSGVAFARNSSCNFKTHTHSHLHIQHKIGYIWMLFCNQLMTRRFSWLCCSFFYHLNEKVL